MTDRPAFLEHAAILSEMTRCRLLRILGANELSVGDVAAVLQLPQSTTSRHLKILSDHSWVRARRDGTSHVYRSIEAEQPSTARELWNLIRSELSSEPEIAGDARRLGEILRRRRSRSREFFSSSATEWDRLRSELFGDHWDAMGLLALLDPTWQVADLGCGTGQLSEVLATYVGKVVAVDGSPEMLDAARNRLSRVPNVDLRHDELEDLSLTDASIDLATLFLVLHHVGNPADVLAEAARITRPGGQLLIVDMVSHEREHYRQTMGHAWLGFSAEQLSELLGQSGFLRPRWIDLEGHPESKGPPLFAAVARRTT